MRPPPGRVAVRCSRRTLHFLPGRSRRYRTAVLLPISDAMTITLRTWHIAAIGILAALGTGILLGATVFRTKTVVTVAAPPKVVTVTKTVLPPEDYLGEAEADVRASVPSAEAYYSDNGSYRGMTRDALLAIDYGLSPRVSVVSATATGYCLEATVDAATASFAGPGGVVSPGACP